jgi:cell division protein FtsW
VNRGDRWLLGLPLALTLVGVVMVYSSSAILGITRYQDPDHFLVKQLFRAGLGVLVMLACTRVDLKRLESWAPGLFAAALALLAVVAVAGHASNGAARWLRLGALTVQPTDLARLSAVVFLASWLKRRPPAEHGFARGVLVPLGLAGLASGLILLQPNLSSAALLALTAIVMVYLAGAPLVQVAFPVGAGAAVAGLMLVTHPYQMERVRTFVAHLFGGPIDLQGSGWQLQQSLVAIGSGGGFGRGLGGGLQKYLFLPEAHTDFIFSILAEELGFIGSTVLIGLFALLLWRGLRAATRTVDPFAALLAGGLTIQLGLYAIVNLSVATGLAPTTGLPLPFVSYGGSALMMNLAAAGLLYRVTAARPMRPRAQPSGGWAAEAA